MTFPNYADLGARVLAMVSDDYIAEVKFHLMGIMTTRIGVDMPADGLTLQETVANEARDVVPGDATPTNTARPGETIKWSRRFWKEVPWWVDDDEAVRLMNNEVLFESQIRSNAARLAEEADSYVLRQWAERSMVMQLVGTNGFADDKASFQDEFSKGINKKLGALHVPRYNRNAILNLDDEANMRGLDGVAYADLRGTPEYVPEFTIGRYYGTNWYATSNMPEIGGREKYREGGGVVTPPAFGTVTISGAHAAGLDVLTWAGGGNPLPGDVVQTATTNSVDHKIWKVDGTKLYIYPGLAVAESDGTALAHQGVYTPSLIGHKDAFGYAPVDLSGRTPILMADHYEDSMVDDATQLNVCVEVKRLHKRTLITFGTYLYAGPNKHAGMGTLVPLAA